MTADDTQVGGHHYKLAKEELQSWNVIHAWQLDYFIGNVLKYVLRHYRKGGVEDIRKAKHYAQKRLELGVCPRSWMLDGDLPTPHPHDVAEAYGIVENSLLYLIVTPSGAVLGDNQRAGAAGGYRAARLRHTGEPVNEGGYVLVPAR